MPVPVAEVEREAERVREFFAAHDAVTLREQGEVVLRLEGDGSGYSLSTEHGKLVLHAWSPERSLVRRVVGSQVKAGRLQLECLRLGQTRPAALLVETAGATGGLARSRAEFRQAVLALLEREWPQWRPVTGWGRGGAAPIQRFVMQHGRRQVVCVAVGEEESEATMEASLGQALLLAKDAGRRYPEKVLAGVRVILPEGRHDTLRYRVGMLRPTPPVELYVLDRAGSRLVQLDAADVGNLASTLARASDPLASLPAAVRELLQEIQSFCPVAEALRGTDGLISFRLHGLEFAREQAGAGRRGGFEFGIGREGSPLDEGTRGLFHALLRALSRQRHAGGDRRNPLYALRPEGWMESLLRRRPDRIDAQAETRWAYAQIPVMRAASRDVMDLLVGRRDGTLLIYELKAEESLDHPLQGLDYWLRVRRHQQQGDFERLGYFPGLRLSEAAPRMVLIYPALRRHARMDDLLAWISPEVPITCVGINEGWREDLQVVDRKEGDGEKRRAAAR